MKTTTAKLALAAGLLSLEANAAAVDRRRNGAPKVVGFGIQRTTTVRDPVARDRLRRRGTVETDLDNLVGLMAPPRDITNI